jgi:hypothetical protein
MHVSKADSNEPRLMTPAERQEEERELNETLARLSFLLPISKCPPVELGGDGRSATAAHEKVQTEIIELGRRRDFLRRWLETGVNPAFERPLNR